MSQSSSVLCSPSPSKRDSEVILVVSPAYVPPSLETIECVIRMIERNTVKVVFVPGLTLVPHATGGMLLPIGIVRDKVRREAELHQVEMVKFAVEEFQSQFSDKKVALEVRVRTGASIEKIVQEAARELLPRWIIVDSSLSTIKSRLVNDPVLHSFSMGFVFGGKLLTRPGVSFFDSPGNVDTIDGLAARRESPCRRNTVSCLGLFTFRPTSSRDLQRRGQAF